MASTPTAAIAGIHRPAEVFASGADADGFFDVERFAGFDLGVGVGVGLDVDDFDAGFDDLGVEVDASRVADAVFFFFVAAAGDVAAGRGLARVGAPREPDPPLAR